MPSTARRIRRRVVSELDLRGSKASRLRLDRLNEQKMWKDIAAAIDAGNPNGISAASRAKIMHTFGIAADSIGKTHGLALDAEKNPSRTRNAARFLAAAPKWRLLRRLKRHKK